MNKISIIIPTLNEAENIKQLLLHILHNSSKNNIADIIVVDGGSTDDTAIIVKTIAKDDNQIQFINTEKGRAKQMNYGAKKARGTVLYFLHADSFPPNNFDQYILTEIRNENFAGCFKMKFDCAHWWLKLAGWLTQFNWRACRGGDQSQFITKTLFEQLNGFNETYIIYEDNDLINKLYAKQQFVVIPEWITTSARRYHTNGIWKLQYHFWMIYIKKWFGASADDLHNYYLKYIKS